MTNKIIKKGIIRFSIIRVLFHICTFFLYSAVFVNYWEYLTAIFIFVYSVFEIITYLLILLSFNKQNIKYPLILLFMTILLSFIIIGVQFICMRFYYTHITEPTPSVGFLIMFTYIKEIICFIYISFIIVIMMIRDQARIWKSENN
jgi:hypothetical protein